MAEKRRRTTHESPEGRGRAVLRHLILLNNLAIAATHSRSTAVGAMGEFCMINVDAATKRGDENMV